VDHVLLLGDEQFGSLLREYRDSSTRAGPIRGSASRSRPRTIVADVSKPIVVRSVLCVATLTTKSRVTHGLFAGWFGSQHGYRPNWTTPPAGRYLIVERPSLHQKARSC